MITAIGANLSEAWIALGATRQRSALALVGIVIGVGSVSAMISVGTIVRGEAARQYQELGTDIVKIRLRARDQGDQSFGLDLAEAEQIVTLPSMGRAAPYTSDRAEAVLGASTTHSIQIIGATRATLDLNRLRIAEGRFISRLDDTSHFATVGDTIAQKLKATEGQALGAAIQIENIVLRVVGTLAPSELGQRAFDPNNAAIVALNVAARVTPRARLRDIMGRMTPGTDHRTARREIENYFRYRAPHARVQVRSAKELIEHLRRQMRLYTLLLGAVGGIALLVGGIGVMNVMLVAVTERTAEIGIRRALGARRRDIQAQFLTEATILSLAGGIIGAGAGVATTYGICAATGWAFSVSWTATVLGTAVAGGAGIVFGLLPAHQAAQIEPVSALQG